MYHFFSEKHLKSIVNPIKIMVLCYFQHLEIIISKLCPTLRFLGAFFCQKSTSECLL